MACRIFRIWWRTLVRTERLRILLSSDWRCRFRACFLVPLIVAMNLYLLEVLVLDGLFVSEW